MQLLYDLKRVTIFLFLNLICFLSDSLPADVPQILINREPLSHLSFDVELLGDCDVIVNELCRRLGDGWAVLNEPGSALTEIMKGDLPTPKSLSPCSPMSLSSPLRKCDSGSKSPPSLQNTEGTSDGSSCNELSNTTTAKNRSSEGNAALDDHDKCSSDASMTEESGSDSVKRSKPIANDQGHSNANNDENTVVDNCNMCGAVINVQSSTLGTNKHCNTTHNDDSKSCTNCNLSSTVNHSMNSLNANMDTSKSDSNCQISDDGSLSRPDSINNVESDSTKLQQDTTKSSTDENTFPLLELWQSRQRESLAKRLNGK